MSSLRYLAHYKPNDGGVYQASGFTAAGFGTPHAVWTQYGQASGFAGNFGTPTHTRSQPATGFQSGDFGTPFGRNIQVVSGFTGGSFGLPRIYPYSVAPGIHSGQFGTPSGRQVFVASPIIQPGRFGTPYITFNQSQTASGFTSGTFGKPMAIRHSPPNTDVICVAASFGPGTFGTPRLIVHQTGVASSVGVGHFGSPKAQIVQRASGFQSGVFGLPGCSVRGHVQGFRSGSFGTPRVCTVHQAAGIGGRGRWGLPTSDFLGTHKATSIYVGERFGQPTARRGPFYVAEGFTSGAFGTPAAVHIHRVASIPPGGRFGRPLLRRNAQC